MIQEIRAYKVDPPADVHKVCKGVLVLLGHGKWAGAEHELKDWDDCRPKITRAMIKDMQVRLRRGLVHDLEQLPMPSAAWPCWLAVPTQTCMYRPSR